jgi:predicted ATPase
MSKIRIKNFGPIREGYLENDGWMDVKKVTVFIGNQGTGKSTVAKSISTMTWMEKAINRGDIEEPQAWADISKHFRYGLLGNYFSDEDGRYTQIEYDGDLGILRYGRYIGADGYFPKFEKKEENNYVSPKIAYISAERNFFTTIKNAYNVKGLPDHLNDFADDLRKANRALNGQMLELPINNLKYEYIESSDTPVVIGTGYKIDLAEAASGLQSFIPLYLVSRYQALSIAEKEDLYGISNMSPNQKIRRDEEIARLMLNDSISDDEKKEKLKQIRGKYKNGCFINIVEEPEQNLYPISQRQILNSLLEFNNMNEGNKLIMTTHSPYIINYLSIAIQGHYLLEKIKNANRDDLLERLQEIVPVKSCIDAKDIIIYQLDENGTIKRLQDYAGIPSDKNYLNNSLAEGNQLFGSLLEIEEDL